MSKVIEASPELWHRLTHPWLYPHVKPTINFPVIQIEKMPDGTVLVHNIDLDEKAILEALRKEE